MATLATDEQGAFEKIVVFNKRFLQYQ